MVKTRPPLTITKLNIVKITSLLDDLFPSKKKYSYYIDPQHGTVGQWKRNKNQSQKEKRGQQCL